MIKTSKWLPLLAVLVSVGAKGQPTQCTVNALSATVTTLRQEGLTELLGDVILNCTGGTPVKSGTPVPQSDLTIYLNANVTSKILSMTGDTWTEALLLIDEPHSTSNPSVPVLACGDGGAPDSTSNPGVCTMTGTGDGVGVYSGGGGRPNVWQGRLSGPASITFFGIPIDAPPNGSIRLLRITNVRIAASQLPSAIDPYTLPNAAMAIAIGGAHPIPIPADPNASTPKLNNIQSFSVGYPQMSIVSDVDYPASFPSGQSRNLDVATGASYSGAIADVVVAVSRYAHGAFKGRNYGYSATSSREENQNVVIINGGYLTGEESGYVNIGPSFDHSPPSPYTYPPTVVPPTAGFSGYHNLVAAGRADSGTHIMVTFDNVPAGVVLAVPTSITTNHGVMYLVRTDTSGVGSTRVLSLPGGAITGCSVNLTTYGCPTMTGIALVDLNAGTGHAVYEVYADDPFSVDSIARIPVVLAYQANEGIRGTATVTASIGPLSTVAAASSTDPIPRFTANATPSQSLFTLASGGPSYLGSLEAVGCQTISGWAADRTRPGQSLVVSLYDGAILIATLKANQARQDIATLLGDNGLHGFSYKVPATMRDGKTHNIRALFDAGSGLDLPGSPGALSCTPTYVGYVESASCTTIKGWVADRSDLNGITFVSLWNGSTLIGYVGAADFRPDVGKLLGDGGSHGFSQLQVPSELRDNQSRTYQVRFAETDIQVPGSPITLTCNRYLGYVESASCNGITGWAADFGRLNISLNVTLWDGATQIGSVTANGSRGDVGTFLSDNGLHGFSMPIPASYGNGTHTLQLHFETSSTQVSGSPVTLTCGGPSYVGYVDSTSCAGITGWAADRSRLNVPLTVTLWDGVTQIGSTTANGARGDVGAVLGDNGLHAFALPIPAGYANGVSHTLQVRYETSSVQVPGSPVTLTCGGGVQYVGYIDSASCAAGINGWAADRSRLNVPLTVTLWDGATQVASTTANGSRGDVGALLGDNGLHAFSLAVPAGSSHSLQVRYEGSATQLPGSPVTLTCGGGANYAGWFDHAGCDALSGWAADKVRLNQSISVDILDGSTLVGTVLASASRGDVGSVLGDNGAHGFSVATPAALKDGKSHSVQVRYAGSTQLVGNSPQALVCSSSTSYMGWVDTVGCSAISGWAADKNALNTSISVEVYDGSTLLGTAAASGSRVDVGAVLGDNGLHGYSFATPGSVKDGKAHTITVRPAGSGTVLAGAKGLTCP